MQKIKDLPKNERPREKLLDKGAVYLSDEELLEHIFGKSISVGMDLFNIVMPSTRSFCHIDFVFNDYRFEPFDNDEYILFMRITNIYDRTKPLKYDISFCRWICKNGMIFDDFSEMHKWFGDIIKTEEYIKN